MAEAAELKHMVMSFRVSELQVLLGFAGRNKSGRKQELLQRALQLVQKGCGLQVQIKIRELYRQIFATNAHRRRFNDTAVTIAPGQPEQPTPTPGIASGYSQRSARSTTATALSNTNQFGVPRSRGVTTSSNNHSLTSIKGCSIYQGIDYGGAKHNITSIHPPSSSMPVHPDVRFKHLPFYDLLAELMKPTSLVPKSNNRFQESFFVFHLTPQQAQDIAMSRDFRPGAKCEYTVQVQLRFCLLETSCEQADNFPPSICVRVNGKMAPLPNPIPTNKPGIEPKRPGRAIDITALCRLSPTISNHLDVSWASEFGRNPVAKKKLAGRALDITDLLKLNPNMRNDIHVSWSSEEPMVGYCLAVFLVRRLSSDILLQRLKQFGNRHPDHTRALIKEKLAHDPDSEIATTSLRVSLMCPLGKMRLQIPCRASTCTHLQCYDACTFLMMNEKKATWICPVCDKPATFDKLIIDGYFLEIFRASPNCNDIQFHPDGNWSRLEQTKETHVISSPVVKPIKPESDTVVIPDTKPEKPEEDVIDLTLDSSDEDDDDDEEPPPKSVSDKGCVSPGIINLDTPTPPHGSTQSVSSSPNSTPSIDLNPNSPSLSPLFTPNSTPPPAHTKTTISPFPSPSLTNPYPPYPLPPLIPSSSLPPTSINLPMPTLSPLIEVDSVPSTSELFPPGTENLTDNEFEKFLNNLNWY